MPRGSHNVQYMFVVLVFSALFLIICGQPRSLPLPLSDISNQNGGHASHVTQRSQLNNNTQSDGYQVDLDKGICREGWVRGYYRNVPVCFRINTQELPWIAARDTCRRDKSFLVKLETPATIGSRDLRDHLKRKNVGTFWSGLHDEHSHLVWDEIAPHTARAYNHELESRLESERIWKWSTTKVDPDDSREEISDEDGEERNTCGKITLHSSMDSDVRRRRRRRRSTHRRKRQTDDIHDNIEFAPNNNNLGNVMNSVSGLQGIVQSANQQVNRGNILTTNSHELADPTVSTSVRGEQTSQNGDQNGIRSKLNSLLQSNRQQFQNKFNEITAQMKKAGMSDVRIAQVFKQLQANIRDTRQSLMNVPTQGQTMLDTSHVQNTEKRPVSAVSVMNMNTGRASFPVLPPPSSTNMQKLSREFLERTENPVRGNLASGLPALDIDPETFVSKWNQRNPISKAFFNTDDVNPTQSTFSSDAREWISKLRSIFDSDYETDRVQNPSTQTLSDLDSDIGFNPNPPPLPTLPDRDDKKDDKKDDIKDDKKEQVSNANSPTEQIKKKELELDDLREKKDGLGPIELPSLPTATSVRGVSLKAPPGATRTKDNKPPVINLPSVASTYRKKEVNSSAPAEPQDDILDDINFDVLIDELADEQVVNVKRKKTSNKGEPVVVPPIPDAAIPAGSPNDGKQISAQKGDPKPDYEDPLDNFLRDFIDKLPPILADTEETEVKVNNQSSTGAPKDTRKPDNAPKLPDDNGQRITVKSETDDLEEADDSQENVPLVQAETDDAGNLKVQGSGTQTSAQALTTIADTDDDDDKTEEKKDEENKDKDDDENDDDKSSKDDDKTDEEDDDDDDDAVDKIAVVTNATKSSGEMTTHSTESSIFPEIRLPPEDDEFIHSADGKYSSKEADKPELFEEPNELEDELIDESLTTMPEGLIHNLTSTTAMSDNFTQPLDNTTVTMAIPEDSDEDLDDDDSKEDKTITTMSRKTGVLLKATNSSDESYQLSEAFSDRGSNETTDFSERTQTMQAYDDELLTEEESPMDEISDNLPTPITSSEEVVPLSSSNQTYTVQETSNVTADDVASSDEDLNEIDDSTTDDEMNEKANDENDAMPAKEEDNMKSQTRVPMYEASTDYEFSETKAFTNAATVSLAQSGGEDDSAEVNIGSTVSPLTETSTKAYKYEGKESFDSREEASGDGHSKGETTVVESKDGVETASTSPPLSVPTTKGYTSESSEIQEDIEEKPVADRISEGDINAVDKKSGNETEEDSGETFDILTTSAPPTVVHVPSLPESENEIDKSSEERETTTDDNIDKKETSKESEVSTDDKLDREETSKESEVSTGDNLDREETSKESENTDDDSPSNREESGVITNNSLERKESSEESKSTPDENVDKKEISEGNEVTTQDTIVRKDTSEESETTTDLGSKETSEESEVTIDSDLDRNEVSEENEVTTDGDLDRKEASEESEVTTDDNQDHKESSELEDSTVQKVPNSSEVSSKEKSSVEVIDVSPDSLTPAVSTSEEETETVYDTVIGDDDRDTSEENISKEDLTDDVNHADGSEEVSNEVTPSVITNNNVSLPKDDRSESVEKEREETEDDSGAVKDDTIPDFRPTPLIKDNSESSEDGENQLTSSSKVQDKSAENNSLEEADLSEEIEQDNNLIDEISNELKDEDPVVREELNEERSPIIENVASKEKSTSSEEMLNTHQQRKLNTTNRFDDSRDDKSDEVLEPFDNVQTFQQEPTVKVMERESGEDVEDFEYADDNEDNLRSEAAIQDEYRQAEEQDLDMTGDHPNDDTDYDHHEGSDQQDDDQGEDDTPLTTEKAVMELEECGARMSSVCFSYPITAEKGASTCDADWYGHVYMDKCYRAIKDIDRLPFLNYQYGTRLCQAMGGEVARIRDGFGGKFIMLTLLKSMKEFNMEGEPPGVWVNSEPVGTSCTMLTTSGPLAVNCDTNNMAVAICEKSAINPGITVSQLPNGGFHFLSSQPRDISFYSDDNNKQLSCDLVSHASELPTLWYKDGRLIDIKVNKRLESVLPHQGGRPISPLPEPAESSSSSLVLNSVVRKSLQRSTDHYVSDELFQGKYWCEVWDLKPFRKHASSPIFVRFSDVITMVGTIKLPSIPEVYVTLYNKIQRNIDTVLNIEHDLNYINDMVLPSLENTVPQVQRLRTHTNDIIRTEPLTLKFHTYIKLDSNYSMATEIKVFRTLRRFYREVMRNTDMLLRLPKKTPLHLIRSMNIRSTVSCPQTLLTDTITGHTATFPSSAVNMKVDSFELCEGERAGKASCTGDFTSGAYWTDVHISKTCGRSPPPPTNVNLKESDEIEDEDDKSDEEKDDYESLIPPMSPEDRLRELAEMEVGEGNVEGVMEETADITDSVDDLNELDVEYIAEIMRKTANTPKMTKFVAAKAIKTVDRVLAMQHKKMTRSRVASRIIQNFEKIAEDTEVDDDSGHFRMVMKNIAMDVYQLPKQPKAVLGFGAKADVTRRMDSDFSPSRIFTIYDKTDMYNDVDVAIQLPPELIQNAMQDKAHGRLFMMVYKEGHLFQDQTVVMNSSEKVNVDGGNDPKMLNSYVISASIGGRKIHGLSNKVMTVYRPLRDPAGKQRTCAFYDFAMNNLSGGWSSSGCEFNGTHNGRDICLCDHLTNFAVLIDFYGQGKPVERHHEETLSIITLIGLSLSILGLSLTIISYIFFRKLRQGRAQQTLFNLALAMLCSWVIFLVGIKQTYHYLGCLIVAILLHYFILASFMWMLMEAFLQYLTFVKVLGTYVRRYTIKSVLIAWGIPLIPIISVLSMDYTLYKGGDQYCWMSLDAFYYAFAIPVGVIVLGNLVVFVITVVSIYRRPRGLRSNQSKHKMAITNLQAAITSFVLLGLSWILGYFAISDARLPFHYAFTILNSLQGFFIFVIFVARKKQVRDQWLIACCCKTPEQQKAQRSLSASASIPSTCSSKSTRSSSSTSSLQPRSNRSDSCQTTTSFISAEYDSIYALPYARVSRDSLYYRKF